MKTGFVKYFQAGGITFKVVSDYPFGPDTFHEKFNGFEKEIPGNDTVEIYHHFDPFDETCEAHEILLARKTPVFSNEFLDVFLDTGHVYYRQKISTEYHVRFNGLAVFNTDHSTGHVYVQGIAPDDYARACLDSLVFFGGDHYLFSNLLSRRSGVLVHGNALAWKDEGGLLIGPSGAGKSTLSGILSSGGFEVINDDRGIIRKKGDDFFLCGSWCHGSSPVVSNRTVPLKNIFLLEQSGINAIEPVVQGKRKLQALMQGLVKPFVKNEQWHNMFDLIEDMILGIDFYRVEFNLDGNIKHLMRVHYEKD